MTDVKRLLEAATPLPWWRNETAVDQGHGTDVVWGPDGDAIATVNGNTALGPLDAADNAALIVYAVNRLPDYEAAVDALEALADAATALENRAIRSAGEFHVWAEERMVTEARDEARAVLARLREAVPS